MFTNNHWSNEEKVIELLEEIIFPYLKSVRESMNLPADQKSMLIFDVFHGQKIEKVKELIESNDCVIFHVPSNTTNYFQMLDLNVNRYAKEFLKEKFELWYADQVQKQVKVGKDTSNIDIPLKLSD